MIDPLVIAFVGVPAVAGLAVFAIQRLRGRVPEVAPA
jgi:hypothetical protein